MEKLDAFFPRTLQLFFKDFMVVRPRNSFFFVVAKLCYHVQSQVAKLILW